MAQYTYAQLEELWIQAGGSKVLAPVMAAIAMAESGGNSDALNLTDNNGTQTSVGLWQVSTGTHDYPPVWLTPAGNAQEAVAKLQEQGITAWGTYNSGAYKQYLQGGVPPAGSAELGGKVPQGGGFGGFVSGVWKDLQLPLTGIEGVLGSASSVGQAILALAGPFIKIAEAVDWLLHPSHWIRIFAGIGGSILVFMGIWQLSHAGAA